jgi:hypothetical protein
MDLRDPKWGNFIESDSTWSPAVQNSPGSSGERCSIATTLPSHSSNPHSSNPHSSNPHSSISQSFMPYGTEDFHYTEDF